MYHLKVETINNILHIYSRESRALFFREKKRAGAIAYVRINLSLKVLPRPAGRWWKFSVFPWPAAIRFFFLPIYLLTTAFDVFFFFFFLISVVYMESYVSCYFNTLTCNMVRRLHSMYSFSTKLADGPPVYIIKKKKKIVQRDVRVL